MRNTILLGVVGSRGYGMARKDSDTDRAGVFMAPTRALLGLEHPPTKYETKNPDHIEHELLPFCQLALRSNPHMLELLWLAEYETLTPVGAELVGIRECFASAYWVRQAYLGYAREQFRRMTRQAPAVGDEQHRKRAKNARHLLRLLTAGEELYTTGTLTVKLPDPERYFAFGEAAAKNPEVARNALTVAQDLFTTRKSPLPEEPQTGPVGDWLTQARVSQLQEPGDGAP
jgi:hypothetical protein